MALTIWLSDRSRHESSVNVCRRQRYLGYHAGPHGYGWARKAQSVPTVTGQLIHSPLALVLDYVRRADRLPSDEVVYACIVEAQNEYRQTVESRGLSNVQDPAALDLRVQEQLTLLEGLVWTWVRGVLPQFHETHTVVDVETEGVTILGCTCGLGDKMGTAEEHDARECAGVGWMTREDAIFKTRAGGVYSYHEFKSTSAATKNWDEGWYHRVQLIAGVMGAEARLGATVDEVYIHGLVKGKYDGTWNPVERKASGPKFQNSPLVYGWYRPAVPGVLPEDWAVSYDYVDGAGKNRRLTKEYERKGIWTMDESLWKQEGVFSPSDFWVRWLAPTGKLADCYKLVGPIYRNDDRLAAFTRQHVAEERRWRDILWRLYELEQAGTGWGTPQFEAVLDAEAPQARGDACQNFFGETCWALPLCNKDTGWHDPSLMGFIARRPHHTPELDQAVARGLLPPDEALAEGEGEGGDR